MKLKTSITILGGCLLIFLFIMLPIVLSIQEKKEDIERLKRLGFRIKVVKARNKRPEIILDSELEQEVRMK